MKLGSRKAFVWRYDGKCIRSTSHGAGNRYPRVHSSGKETHLSRIILEKKLGPLPDGIIARHTCDNMWCINPDHIIPGTHYDNCMDRVQRGRSNSARGEQLPQHILTEAQVRLILQSGETTRVLATRYGVTLATIRSVKRRLRWKHVRLAKPGDVMLPYWNEAMS